MVRINRNAQDTSVVFGVVQSEAGKHNVRIVEYMGEPTNSGIVFSSRSIDAVHHHVRYVKITNDYLMKYRVHPRIKPNRPKRKEFMLVKAHLMHLEKYNIALDRHSRIASHYLVSELRKQMFADMDYQIVRGATRELKIPIGEYEKMIAKGLILADISDVPEMKGANGKSKKVLKAGMKMQKGNKNYKISFSGK